jgi:hypothetical protein
MRPDQTGTASQPVLARTNISRVLRHRMLQLGVCGLVAVPYVLSIGASSGVAEGLDFRGELKYETFDAAAANDKKVRIKRSPGGTGAAAMALARVKRLVIDGRCDSACAWAFARNPNACFTARASFGFHGAHDPGTGRRMPVATKYWLGTVRAPLRGRLEVLVTSDRVIRLSSTEMRRYYADRVCGARTSVIAAGPVVLPVKKPASGAYTFAAGDVVPPERKGPHVHRASLGN